MNLTVDGVVKKNLSHENKTMKPEQLYQNLVEIAEKLSIKVSEGNFRKTSIHVKSGFCRVKDENHFIIDKRLPVFKKNIIMANFLNTMPINNIYIIPAARDFRNKYNKDKKAEIFED